MVEFIEGEAPAFTIQQMILDLMDLCYYDGARAAGDNWSPATKKIRDEIFQDLVKLNNKDWPTNAKDAIMLELSAILSGSYNKKGFQPWLNRKRTHLFNRSPLTVLETCNWDRRHPEVCRVFDLANSLRFGGMGT